MIGNLYKIIFLSLLLSSQLQAQWESGISFNYKSEIPEIGFGFFAARNLPVQFADIGVKVRTGIDYYFGSGTDQNNINLDLHAGILATIFYLYVQPYFGLTVGVSRYSANDFNEYIFFLGSFAGIKIPVTNRLLPFIEIYSNKYFGNFDEQKTNQSISSVQIAGRAGVIVKF